MKPPAVQFIVHEGSDSAPIAPRAEGEEPAERRRPNESAKIGCGLRFVLDATDAPGGEALANSTRPSRLESGPKGYGGWRCRSLLAETSPPGRETDRIAAINHRHGAGFATIHGQNLREARKHHAFAKAGLGGSDLGHP